MKTSLTFILLFSSSFLFSQDNKGFYGSNKFVTIETLISNPLIYNFRKNSNDYNKYNKDLEQKNDHLNYGFRATFGMLVKRNVALCFETGIDYANIYTENNYDYDYNYSNSENTKMSKLNIQTYSFMPKIEFSSKKSLLPLGFSHQIGLGFCYSKLIDKEYPIETQTTTSDDYTYDQDGNYIYIPGTTTVNKTTSSQTKFYDYENAPMYKTYTFLYALSLRTALTKNLLLNYGFRYTLNVNNLFESILSSQNPTETYLLSHNDIRQNINNQRFLNVITFNIGVTYAF